MFQEHLSLALIAPFSFVACNFMHAKHNASRKLRRIVATASSDIITSHTLPAIHPAAASGGDTVQFLVGLCTSFGTMADFSMPVSDFNGPPITHLTTFGGIIANDELGFGSRPRYVVFVELPVRYPLISCLILDEYLFM